MFQVNLPRALIVSSLVLILLSGCTTPPPPKTRTVTRTVTQECACAQVLNWLQIQQEVSALSIDEVSQTLAVLEKPGGGEELFYYGVLNQQLDVFTHWTEARDAFRLLALDDRLTWEQQRLAAILERYNQSRINWYEQNRKLEEENKLLIQKIQAITDLETNISTRMEQ